MGSWKWTEGRQATGYQVMTLWASKKLKCDLHLIKYDPGSKIPPHTDPSPVPEHIHHRVNAEWLSKDCVGGLLMIEGKRATPFFKAGRLQIYKFQSSEQTHEVTALTQGRRWVLSLGWLSRIGMENCPTKTPPD